MYQRGVLTADVAQFLKYGLQVQVQGRRFERVTERLENKKAVCRVLALFGACVFIHDFRYAKKARKMISAREACWQPLAFPIVEFPQTEFCTENYLVYSS